MAKKRLPTIVYKITHRDSGLSYIGITIRSLRQRWMEHCNSSHNDRLRRSIKKYGKDAFDVVVLEMADTPEAAALRERELIAEYNTLSPNGFNLSTGGEMLPGGQPSQEAREKMAAAKRGRKVTLTDDMYARMFSDEAKAKRRATMLNHPKSAEISAKISAARKGKKRSPESVAKGAAANKGKKRSDETRAKMSAAKKGKPLPPETLRRATAAHIGRKHTDEERAKISAANRGRKHTPEARARIATANQKRFAEKRIATFEANGDMLLPFDNLPTGHKKMK